MDNMKVILNDTLKKCGRSQYWLAKQTGIATSTINNLCNGKQEKLIFPYYNVFVMHLIVMQMTY